MHTNLLIHETSPYLLQHAHNPVNWYPWGSEALQKAKEENKPILVSIGYAACHWCHVMERESFENEEIAAIMNRDFVNIKIDREERPDLDHIYMDAVQAMTGSGGWPLNVFLTPEAKPFYGGTYFPPRPAYNRASWQDTLLGVAKAFRERRHEIDAQAEQLTSHLVSSNAFGMEQLPADTFFTSDKPQLLADNIMKQADREWGGFGRAPKFPQSFSIKYLLRYHWTTGDQATLQQALLSIDKMLEGGIYDQLGGGFARYSTDTEWLVPHFEKMLYDNALLLGVLAEALQLTGADKYRRAIEETMTFIEREMTDASGGWYAALDADSEGVEGKFYVWDDAEVKEVLGENASLFCEYYDITEKGNWSEGGHVTNILRIQKTLSVFAAEKGMEEAALLQLLEICKQQLLQRRSQRIRPLLDDKVILGWNALMNTAASKAFAATGKEEYRQMSLRNMEFLLRAFNDGQQWHHTWKNGEARYPAFLDDLAFLAEALLQLQEITTDTRWLKEAEQIAEHIQERFREENTAFFYYTGLGQDDVIVRKKEVYDGALPSGNAVMADNLHRLGILLDKTDWKEKAAAMIATLGNAITRYPTSFGHWACLLQEMICGTEEIAILGSDYEKILYDVIKEYVPHRVLMAAGKVQDGYPLLEGKTGAEKTLIHCCRNYTCQLPVFSAKELMLLINKGKKA